MSSTNTTRRTAIATLAAAAIVPSTAIAAAPDPIFTLIKAHKQAEQAHSDAFDVDEDNCLPELDAYNDAMERLCDARPTTVAGLSAKMEYLTPYLEEFFDAGGDMCELWHSTTETVRRLMQAGAQP